MENNKLLIWSSDYSKLFEEYKKEDEENRSDESLSILADEDNYEALEEIVRSLNGIELKNNIIIFADFGLWNGRHIAYKELGTKLSSILSFDNFRSVDEFEYYVDNDEFTATGYHHDGTNYYYYRTWKAKTTESQKEKLLSKIISDKTLDMEMLNTYTKKIGNLVLKAMKENGVL